MGMRQESMLKLFDPSALEMYNSCSDLALVCEAVAQPKVTRAQFNRITYMRALKPMLASSPPWEQVMTKMKGKMCYVEDKYDGERIMLHKKDGIIKMFTR